MLPKHASEGLRTELVQLGCNLAVVEIANANDRAMLRRCLRCLSQLPLEKIVQLPEQLAEDGQWSKQPTQKRIVGPTTRFAWAV